MANEIDYNPCQYIGNGITREFSYNWKTFNDTDLIVELETVSTGDIRVLNLTEDYTVQIDIIGGTVILITAPSEDYYVNLKRKTSNLQSTRYSTSVGFQGSELEKSFDRFSCNLQEMNYSIEDFKTEITNTTDKKIEDFETEINNKIIQVNDAVEKLDKLDTTLTQCEVYSANALNSAEQSTANLNEIQQIKDDVIELSTNTQTEISNLGETIETNIQALGVYMENERLFYVDTNGIKHEFRNDYGGIAPMPVKHRSVIVQNNGFALTWTDPEDSFYKENIYCKWDHTLIVRKIGSYPENPYDGDKILISKIRNQYAETPYIDEVDTSIDYKYRAFPCSINKVYSYDNKNKFGVWIYGFEENDLEPNPAKRITYLEDNKYFKENIMNFSIDEFNYADWENSPFYHWDYIRPCMLYNSSAVDSEGNNLCGQVMEYLDPDDYSKTIDGSPSHYADQNCNANAMVEKRKIFLKIEIVNENKTRYYFSNEKLDEDYECYPCLREDGTYNEFYYTPMFSGSLVNNKIMSLGGGLTAISSRTAQQEIDLARANGNGYDTEVWADILYEELIFKLTFKNTDSQSVLGVGVTNSSNSLSSSGASGRAYNKGANYGTNGSDFPVKFRHRENFYAYQWQRFRGLIYINGIPYVKMTKHTGDGTTINDYNITGENYIKLNEVPVTSGTSGGYISKTKATQYGPFSTVVSGSSSTYLADGRWYNNSGTMYPLRGGTSNSGSLCGVFCLASDDASSASVWIFGASLSFKPL